MDNKGFTLLEVILVVFIMGILGTVLVPNVFKTKNIAEKRVENVNKEVLKSAAYLYILDNPEKEKEDMEIKMEDLESYLEKKNDKLDKYRIFYRDKKIEIEKIDKND